MTFTSKLACLALLAPGFMMASISVGPPPGPPTEVYNYSINATGLNVGNNPPTEDISSTWNLTFGFLGPEMFAAGPNTLLSFAVTGTPASGWTYDNSASGLTSYGSDGAAKVTFDDTNASTDGLGINSVTYTFYGTNAFWAAPGGPFTFGNTSDPNAYSGAFSTLNPGGDPPCSACTITTTQTAITPEPGSLGLLALFIGTCLVPFRKKQQKRPA
jgi:hypothetical protein